MDSLKALDPNRPIREADIGVECAPGAGQFHAAGFDSLPGVVILELCWA